METQRKCAINWYTSIDRMRAPELSPLSRIHLYTQNHLIYRFQFVLVVNLGRSPIPSLHSRCPF